MIAGPPSCSRGPLRMEQTDRDLGSSLMRVVVSFTMMLLAGCAVTGPESAGDAISSRRDLAVRASQEGFRGTPSNGAGKSSPRKVDEGSQSKGGTSSGSDRAGEQGSSNPTVPFVRAGLLDDPRGDVPEAAPSYADVISILIEDDGESVRITVEFASSLPARTAPKEVVGVGVDLVIDEDEYQVFGSGEPQGWFAYLSGPSGLQRYRGTFSVAGKSLVFTVPWSVFGGESGGTFSAFVDWTGSHSASEDLAPGRGTATFQP